MGTLPKSVGNELDWKCIEVMDATVLGDDFLIKRIFMVMGLHAHKRGIRIRTTTGALKVVMMSGTKLEVSVKHVESYFDLASQIRKLTKLHRLTKSVL